MALHDPVAVYNAASNVEAHLVRNVLADSGIETRFWWNRGCHREALFAGLSRTALPVTDALAAATLGLPCYADLPDGGIAAICAEVGRALAINWRMTG